MNLLIAAPPIALGALAGGLPGQLRFAARPGCRVPPKATSICRKVPSFMSLFCAASATSAGEIANPTNVLSSRRDGPDW